MSTYKLVEGGYLIAKGISTIVVAKQAIMKWDLENTSIINESTDELVGVYSVVPKTIKETSQ